MRQSSLDFEELMEQVPETRKDSALRQIIARNNTCQIWIGGSENDRFSYPYRLVPVTQITDRVRRVATELMLDSSIGDREISNEFVISKALEYDAQYVVPKDYWGEIDKTHESIKEFLDIYDDTGCSATIIFPLQPPHDTHYTRYESFYSTVSHVAVGGVKEWAPADQMAAVKTTRDAVGPYTHVHGLGMGSSREVIDTLRENPTLLDSLDTSTFEQLPGFGKVADSHWKQQQIDLPQGDNISTINAVLTEFMVYMMNYQLSSFPDENQFPTTQSPTTDESQTTLEDTWETTAQNPQSDATSEESPIHSDQESPTD